MSLDTFIRIAGLETLLSRTVSCFSIQNCKANPCQSICAMSTISDPLNFKVMIYDQTTPQSDQVFPVVLFLCHYRNSFFHELACSR